MTSDTLNPCPLIQPPSTDIQSLECGPGSGCHPASCRIEQNTHPDRSRRQNPGAVALGAPTNPRPRRGQLPPARPRRRHIRPRRHVRRADHRARPHRPRAPVPPRRNPDGGFHRMKPLAGNVGKMSAFGRQTRSFSYENEGVPQNTTFSTVPSSAVARRCQNPLSKLNSPPCRPQRSLKGAGNVGKMSAKCWHSPPQVSTISSSVRTASTMVHITEVSIY